MSTKAHATVERQLPAARTSKIELDAVFRERDLQVEHLERDGWLSADQQSEERRKLSDKAMVSKEQTSIKGGEAVVEDEDEGFGGIERTGL